MTPPIRLRRHTDGRVAISLIPHSWRLFAARTPSYWVADNDVSGEGWSELLVTELPEPDGHLDDAPYWSSGHNTLPSWVAYPNLIEGENGVMGDPDELRSDALKMLAAVAACERYRAQREEER